MYLILKFKKFKIKKIHKRFCLNINNPKSFIKEGSTKILKSKIDSSTKKKKEVFYNPVQIFNRDISLLITNKYAENQKKKMIIENKVFEGIKFYDALTATGLRAFRVYQEMPDDLLNSITACDLNKNSEIFFEQNLLINNLKENKKINFILGDTNKIMYNTDKENKYDIIDIDPYGSCIPFFYSSLNAIKNEGLICLTCTDTRVLFGKDKHKCFYLYGSTRGGTDFIQETGLRILLQRLNSIANCVNKSIKVIFSFQSDFYVRVFIQILDGKKNCSKSIKKNGLQFYCQNCCFQYIHRFGKEKKNGEFSVNDFKMDYGNCSYCKSSLKLSFLNRWTIMVRFII